MFCCAFRAKHIKASPCVSSSSSEDNKPVKVFTESSASKDDTCDRILDKVCTLLKTNCLLIYALRFLDIFSNIYAPVKSPIES